MQDQHPIAYSSKSLGPKQQALSIYERELLAIIYAIQKWSTYLEFAPFTIKTDQRNMKYISEQRLTTPFQQVWISKLMGFEFDIQYKEGSSNTAVDALSHKEGAELQPLLMDNGHSDLFTLIQQEWYSDPHLKQLVTDLEQDLARHPKSTWTRNELRRKGKLVLGCNSTLKSIIFKWLHDSAVGGHSGRDIASSIIKSLFVRKGLSKDIQHYIRHYGICQVSKLDQAASPGLLQPLQDISLDFIEGLPSSKGKQTSHLGGC